MPHAWERWLYQALFKVRYLQSLSSSSFGSATINMINLTELVQELNNRKLYSGLDKNQKPFLTIQGDNGEAYFINRAVVNASIDANGQPVPLIVDGKRVFTWAIGAQLKAKEEVQAGEQQTLGL
jgi:hypothetical protein